MISGRISAAPTVLRFTDGNEYFFHPITDKEFDIIDEWLQTKYVENFMRGIPPEMPKERQLELIDATLKASIKVTFLSPQGIQLLGTLQGMTFITWVALRKSHPDITQDQVRELVMIPENLKQVNQAFKKVNAVPIQNPPTASTRKSKTVIRK